jgi:hypothetical protein
MLNGMIFLVSELFDEIAIELYTIDSFLSHFYGFYSVLNNLGGFSSF